MQHSRCDAHVFPHDDKGKPLFRQWLQQQGERFAREQKPQKLHGCHCDRISRPIELLFDCLQDFAQQQHARDDRMAGKMTCQAGMVRADASPYLLFHPYLTLVTVDPDA